MNSILTFGVPKPELQSDTDFWLGQNFNICTKNIFQIFKSFSTLSWTTLIAFYKFPEWFTLRVNESVKSVESESDSAQRLKRNRMKRVKIVRNRNTTKTNNLIFPLHRTPPYSPIDAVFRRVQTCVQNLIPKLFFCTSIFMSFQSIGL